MLRSKLLQRVISAPVVNNAFQMLVKSDNAGTSTDTQFTIPTGTGTFNYDVEWYEQGNESNSGTLSAQTGDATIDFGSAGTYVVKITGTFPHIQFNNGGDKDKLLEVQNWGDIVWGSMSRAFFGCSNMDVLAEDVPNLLSVSSDFEAVFRNCVSLKGNNSFNNWDVSNVQSLELAFMNTKFNAPIGNWDVSNVTNLNGTFWFNAHFDQDLSSWDVSSVIDMNRLFEEANNFNNGGVPLTWNTSSVLDMGWVFRKALSFNQDLSSWDFSNATNLSDFLARVTLSTANYDALLIQLEATCQNNSLSFHGGSSTYTSGSAAETARTALINDHGWTITDGGAV